MMSTLHVAQSVSELVGVPHPLQLAIELHPFALPNHF
jgi:hypothetical protein